MTIEYILKSIFHTARKGQKSRQNPVESPPVGSSIQQSLSQRIWLPERVGHLADVAASFLDDPENVRQTDTAGLVVRYINLFSYAAKSDPRHPPARVGNDGGPSCSTHRHTCLI